MNKFNDFLQRYGAYMALLPALVALLGSLYYSEIAGFLPCTLCWYQRILMYPLTIIILVGIFTQDEYLPNYVLPLSIMGMFVSGYHYLIEWGVFAQPTACAATIPCDIRWVNYLGFITISFQALVAFVLITIIMAAVKWGHSTEAAPVTAPSIATGR
jgi:disulfide bond formation protein DsbB